MEFRTGYVPSVAFISVFIKNGVEVEQKSFVVALVGGRTIRFNQIQIRTILTYLLLM